MPVSRKRKKKSKSGNKSRSKSYVSQAGRDGKPKLTGPLAALADHRRQLTEHRASLADARAEHMVTELLGFAARRPGSDLEDELCARMGRTLAEFADGPLENHVNPNDFAVAIIEAAANAVDAALAGEEADRAPAWRLLNAVTSIVNHPLSEWARESTAELRAQPGGQRLPKPPAAPALTGPVMWTRDAYGSRFGVAAPFRAGDGPTRWYLWDIDACGHDAFTVHSRYHAGADDALADWQAGVGAPAADGTAFAPVDDPGLLRDLMPREKGSLRTGGENVAQLAEYHRSKRLAEAVLVAVVPGHPDPAAKPAGLDRITSPVPFTAWLRQHRPDRFQHADLDELLIELAESWQIGGPAKLYETCSPHRVALTAEHIRDYYQDDFAAELIAMLPDWTTWLADHNATPAHLAERCHPYALGEPHKAISADDGRTDYLARVIE